MVEGLANRWWVFLVRGIAGVVLGIIAFAWPGLSLVALAILFGAYAFVIGMFALAAALAGIGGSRWWALLLEGIAGVVIAFFLWTEPGIGALGLVYAVAIWAMLTGVMEIVAGLQLRELVSNEWLYILAGVVSIAFGILVLRNVASGAGIIVVAWTIAAYTIIFGLTQFGVSYRLYQLRSVAQEVRQRL